MSRVRPPEWLAAADGPERNVVEALGWLAGIAAFLLLLDALDFREKATCDEGRGRKLKDWLTTKLTSIPMLSRCR